MRFPCYIRNDIERALAVLESLRAELDAAERAQADAYASRGRVAAVYLAALTKDR